MILHFALRFHHSKRGSQSYKGVLSQQSLLSKHLLKFRKQLVVRVFAWYYYCSVVFLGDLHRSTSSSRWNQWLSIKLWWKERVDCKPRFQCTSFHKTHTREHVFYYRIFSQLFHFWMELFFRFSSEVLHFKNFKCIGKILQECLTVLWVFQII